MFSGITQWINELTADPSGTLITLAYVAFCILFSLILHECAHGWVALKCGDPTAKMLGRLTLNPAKHLDPLGTICMVFLHVGWAKPVPVNMRNFRHPKQGMAITALAGPACNLLITIVFLLLYGLLYSLLSDTKAGDTVLELFMLTAYMSLGLCLFNLLPVPPLDGSKVLFSLLPDSAYVKLMQVERYGSILLLLLVWTGILGKPFSRLIQTVFSWLFPIAEAVFHLVNG